MDKIFSNEPMLFGFWCMFGFYVVRFLVHVRVLCCSVCTVDFVEKLWENLRETLWESCGKVSTVMCVTKFYTFWSEILHRIKVGSGKFSEWFYTRFDLCKMGGFAHFPHSLLLQLLIN